MTKGNNMIALAKEILTEGATICGRSADDFDQSQMKSGTLVLKGEAMIVKNGIDNSEKGRVIHSNWTEQIERVFGSAKSCVVMHLGRFRTMLNSEISETADVDAARAVYDNNKGGYKAKLREYNDGSARVEGNGVYYYLFDYELPMSAGGDGPEVDDEPVLDMTDAPRMVKESGGSKKTWRQLYKDQVLGLCELFMGAECMGYAAKNISHRPDVLADAIMEIGTNKSMPNGSKKLAIDGSTHKVPRYGFTSEVAAVLFVMTTPEVAGAAVAIGCCTKEDAKARMDSITQHGDHGAIRMALSNMIRARLTKKEVK